MTESLLLQGVRETGTELWNDSCGIDDLPYALANGATGATSNPPIVLGIVRAEGRTWRDRCCELVGEHPAWGEGDIAWRLIEEVATRGAGLLAPIHERTGGRQGRLSAQVSPTLFRDADAMLAQEAARLWRSVPTCRSSCRSRPLGWWRSRRATYRGIEVNVTANFTVAGAIAVAEAVERGLDRRAADGIDGPLHPVCTLMVGRLDDWVKAACDRDGVLLTPGRAEWAGVAVFKRAFAIYAERGYRTRLLGGAFRHHLAWSQLLGGDTILTIPPAWQRWLNASGLPVEARLGEPVDPAILAELGERVPEFQLAYGPDGLAPAELETYGASCLPRASSSPRMRTFTPRSATRSPRTRIASPSRLDQRTRTGSHPSASRSNSMTGFTLRDPNDIGVAVLGAGRMGRVHVRNLGAIPNAHVVVVADPNPDAAEAGRVLAGARRATADPLDAINDPDVEAVVINTPTTTHATYIEAALRAGKAVWTEKPIAQELADTAKIVDLWRETGLPVQVGFMRRFDPGLRARQGADRRGRRWVASSSSGRSPATPTRRPSSSC